MSAMWIIIAALAAGTVAGIGFGLKKDSPALGICGGVLGLITVVLAITVGFMQVMPSYRVWKANQEKRIQVTDATAKADSAIELARAEVERAKGTSDANKIVAGSITEPYLRYLYIQALMNGDNQVIYVPTEAGLPILEAGRIGVGTTGDKK